MSATSTGSTAALNRPPAIPFCPNYSYRLPKATGLHLCLLLNFGMPRLEIKRLVLAL
jgi:hypothetical protein